MLAANIPPRHHLHPHASVILCSHAKTGPVKYNYTTLIREPLPSTSEEHGFAEYPFVLSRPSCPSTTSARLSGLYQVPLRFVQTSKSEDPKYHDNPEGIQIRQVSLPMTQNGYEMCTTTVDPQQPRGSQVPCRDLEHLWKLVRL
ncbi:hypothetical protein CFC21_052413, partial [Triticum aestivum]